MRIESPRSAADAAELLTHGKPVRIVGMDTKRDFGSPVDSSTVLSTQNMTGIVEYSPQDLVVVVRAGTPLADLQAELEEHNQWLPIPPTKSALDAVTAGFPGTVGGLVSANLPTCWDSWTRGVRYWVLGLTIVRANGEIAKCGSKAVKNVAGYDAQKAFIGAWGTLGLITEVVLRVYAKPPSTPASDLITTGDWDGVPPLAIARAPIVDALVYAKSTFPDRHVIDSETGTIWAPTRTKVDAPEGGWAMFAGLGDKNWLPAKANLDWMSNLKRNLDPHNLLNPGKLDGLL